MNKTIPSYLRIHTEPTSPERVVPDFGEFRPLCDSFERATGFELRLEMQGRRKSAIWGEAEPTDLESMRMEAIVQSPTGVRPKKTVRDLANSISSLTSELGKTRWALREREAELAAHSTTSPRSTDCQDLAARLEWILQSGTEAIGGHAAALYLLDESTSELKLRASFGLAPERLVAAPRPLRGAAADLEALVGNVVVLDEETLLGHWNAPENFPSAVCAPVSSQSTVLGTVWFFCEHRRDFSNRDTGVVELVAGRLAAELERQSLLLESVEQRQINRHIQRAARWQETRLPSIAPLVEGWQVAAKTQQAKSLGGNFHDWRMLDDGRLAVAVGSAKGHMSEAALTSTVVQSAVRAHSSHEPNPARLMTLVNETLWTTSPGDEFASLGYIAVDPVQQELEYTLAGDICGLHLGSRKCEPLHRCPTLLGEQDDPRFESKRCEVQPGDLVILFSTMGQENELLHMFESELRRSIARRKRAAADKLVEVATDVISGLRLELELEDDLSVVVIRRRKRKSGD